MRHGNRQNPVGRVIHAIGRRVHTVGGRVHAAGRRQLTVGRRHLSIGRPRPAVGRRVLSLFETPERRAASSGGAGARPGARRAASARAGTRPGRRDEAKWGVAGMKKAAPVSQSGQEAPATGASSLTC